MALPISKAKARREWSLYLFVLPSLALVLLFSYYPVLSAVYHTFFEWAGDEVKEYVGLANFERILSDTIFWNSFIVITLLILANVIKTVPSLLLAVLIHRLRSDKWQYWYRVLVVLPMVVPQIVTIFIWKFFFDPNLGILNKFLDFTGGKHLLVWMDGLFGWEVFAIDRPIGWLSTPELIIPSLILWGFPWIGQVGVLIFLAGLQAIDKSLYESSELDGCGPYRKFRHIELPLVMTQVRISLVLLIINTLNGYGIFLVILGYEGGPDSAGMVPGLWMFNRAFKQGEFGYACALGMVIFAFILILTWINNKYVRVDK